MEELIPITYHLEEESFLYESTVVEPGIIPTSMMLIGEGICDVIWKPIVSRNSEKETTKGNIKVAEDMENPMDKFSDSLHKIFVVNKQNSINSEQHPDSINTQGFKVQRLMRGEAMTVRSLSALDFNIPSQLKIVAASRSVKIFKFRRSQLENLPENIRVVLLHAERLFVRQFRIL